jgi:hypothetical protein
VGVSDVRTIGIGRHFPFRLKSESRTGSRDARRESIVQTQRCPAGTGARRRVNSPICVAAERALGAEFDALKSRLEHCRDLIERVLRLMSADAHAVEQEPEMFDHGPQGAD